MEFPYKSARHFITIYWDIIAVGLAFVSIVTKIPILRTILGCMLVLFFPGYSLYVPLIGRKHKLLEKLTFSMILSIPISCTIGFLVGMLSFNVLPITLTLSILSIFGIIIGKQSAIHQETNDELTLTGTDKLLIGLLISILLLLVGIPYLLLGAPSDKGYMFSAPWQRRDLFWHIALSEEIMKGVPPRNPYFAGANFVVYAWFFHLHFALISLLSGIPILHLFRFLPTVYTFLFALGSFFFVLRGFHNVKMALAAAFFCTLSNEMGWVRFVRDLVIDSGMNDPISLINLNRGYFGGHWHGNVFPIIEYFFTPQPQAIGFILMITILYFLRMTLTYRDMRFVSITGFLLGNLALTHGLTFIAVCTIMGGVFITKMLLKRPTSKSHLFPFTATLVIFGIGAAIGSVILLPLQVLSPSILLQPFQIYTWVSVIHIPRILGIMGIFALIGLLTCLKRRSDFDIFLLSWIISIFIVANLLFIQDPYGQGWDILRFVDFMLIPLGIFAGKGFIIFVQKLQNSMSRFNSFSHIKKSSIWIVVILLLAMSSVLTGLMSVYYSTPEFYVSQDEMNAMRWIQKSTEKDTIFICSYDFYEIAFAKRRVVFTNPRFMSQYKMDVNERMNDVDTFFATSNRHIAKEIIQKYDIGYVYVGRLEKASYPIEGLKKLDSWEDLFVKVYEQSEISIYRINDYKDGNIVVQWDGASDLKVLQQFYIGVLLYIVGLIICVVIRLHRRIWEYIFYFRTRSGSNE